MVKSLKTGSNNTFSIRCKLALLVLVISGLTARAQPDFYFSGYVLDQPIFQRASEDLAGLLNFDQDIFVNLTRLRLRPSVNFGDNSRLNVEYEMAGLYFTAENTFLLDPGGKTNRQIVDLSWNLIDSENYILNHYIDRLYFRQDFDWGNIVLGRQRISWGTGRVWNPTDLFNPLNPANFSKIEKDGADAISLMYNIGQFTDLNVVYNPQEEISNSNFGFRFRTNFAEYDAALVGGNFDNRYIIGLDFAGNLFDAGVRGEGIYSINENDPEDTYVKFILGADYQFTPDLYAAIEYHFNGEGKTEKFEYELERLIKGEILNLSKNYLYVMANYQITPLLIGTLMNLSNLNDNSGFAGLFGNYSITEDFYLGLGFQLSYGEDFTEYWYYPNSVYMQFDYYF